MKTIRLILRILALLLVISIGFQVYGGKLFFFSLLIELRIAFIVGAVLFLFFQGIVKEKVGFLLTLLFLVYEVFSVSHLYFIQNKKAMEVYGYHPSDVGTDYTVLTFNTLYTNIRGAEEFYKYAEESKADFIVFFESNYYWQTTLRNLCAKDYPYSYFYSRDATGPKAEFRNISFVSRVQYTSVEVDETQPMPIIHVVFQLGTKDYNFFLVHPKAPRIPSEFQERNRYFQYLVETYGDLKNKVIIGDFNMTPFSPWYDVFFRQKGYFSTSEARPFFTTWSTPLPLVPIDNVLVANEGIVIKHVERGPNLHSDHYPVKVELFLKTQ